MATLMEQVEQRRLYDPTEEDVESALRIAMTLGNAQKILRGEKTQTRRTSGLDVVNQLPDEWTFLGANVNPSIDGPQTNFRFQKGPDRIHTTRARYGEPGDRLLVVTPHWRTNDGGLNEHVGIWEEATRMYRGRGVGEIPDCEPALEQRDDWHQIHAGHLMPRWASRIAVEIQDVRVEQVQEIGPDEVLAEGVSRSAKMMGGPNESVKIGLTEDFAATWDALHGEGAWDENPWVFVYEFDLVKDDLP